MSFKRVWTGRLTQVAVATASLLSLSAQAASNAQIDKAIQDGLAYLATNQQTNQQGGGYWNYGGYEQAATGAAAYAMQTQSGQWGGNTAAYQGDVDKAIKYLLDTATITSVSNRGDGKSICPGASPCTGVYWYGAGESTYTTGLIAPAIALYAASHGGAGAVATTTGQFAGKTWGEIGQAIVNVWSAAQSVSGSYTGGWRYGLGQGSDADMSTTQWGIISLSYMKTLGATPPGFVNDDLGKFLAFAQAAGQGGAGCYQGSLYPLCDHSDTGGLLLGLNYLGKAKTDPAVQAALGFLNNNWTATANSTWYGNFGHPYAMWSVYKGLETTLGLDDDTVITSQRLGDCSNAGAAPDSGVCNWWQDYNDYLVQTQGANGGWAGYGSWYGNLATAFYLPILGGTQIPQPNPEPGTVALVGLALAGLAVSRKGRKA